MFCYKILLLKKKIYSFFNFLKAWYMKEILNFSLRIKKLSAVTIEYKSKTYKLLLETWDLFIILILLSIEFWKSWSIIDDKAKFFWENCENITVKG